MWTRQENWKYNALLGGIGMAKAAMRRIRQHPAASLAAYAMAGDILTQLAALETEIRTNKQESRK